jgi:hypothetical protein
VARGFTPRRAQSAGLWVSSLCQDTPMILHGVASPEFRAGAYTRGRGALAPGGRGTLGLASPERRPACFQI